MLKWQTTSFAIAYMYLRLSVPVFPSPHQAKCSCFFGFVLFFLHSIKRCGWRCFGYQASQKKECVNAFASSFDCSKKQWCNWRSSSLVPPTPRHHIPSAWFTCSGNTVGLLLLLYPWQWTPAVALDPGSSDGLISMHGWGLRSSLIGPVSSWHGLGLNPAEDPAGCVHPPPIMHTPAVFHMTGSYRTQRPCSPVKWMSVPECLTDSHAMLASLCALATLKKKENLQNKNLNVQSNICTCCKNRQILHHCFFFSGLSELFSLFSQSAFFFFFASHPFWGGAFQRRQMKRKYPVYNPVSRHFCPLIWFSAASVPALQPR